MLPESTPPSQDLPPVCDLLKCLRIPESTPPSQNIPPFSKKGGVCDLPRIYPHYQPIYMCDPPRIYPSLPESTPLSTNVYVRPSQNLPLPSRIYPPFQQLNATLPESTLRLSPPRIYPPPFFSTTMCDSQNLYPSSPENNHLFNNCMRPSQNLPLPPRIYPFFNTYMRPSQILPPPPLFNNQRIVRRSQILPLPPNYTPPPFNNYMRHSQNLPLPPRM